MQIEKTLQDYLNVTWPQFQDSLEKEKYQNNTNFFLNLSHYCQKFQAEIDF